MEGTRQSPSHDRVHTQEAAVIGTLSEGRLEPRGVTKFSGPGRGCDAAESSVDGTERTAGTRADVDNRVVVALRSNRGIVARSRFGVDDTQCTGSWNAPMTCDATTENHYTPCVSIPYTAESRCKSMIYGSHFLYKKIAGRGGPSQA
jgi:hypothetical protein